MKNGDKNSGNRSWSINNGVQGYDLSTLPRCTATAKSTGKQCRNAAIKGRNFCAMHARTYIPGRKKGSKGPRKHGLYTSELVKKRKEASKIISTLNQTVSDMKQHYYKEKTL